MSSIYKSARDHVLYHKNGSGRAKGKMIGDVMVGYWEWFRKDGTKLRSGTLENGEQTGKWTTYDKKGEVYKVTDMKPKAKKRGN
jgi:antitoxin component YwqK of YwqJK toxin-antitoxin module